MFDLLIHNATLPDGQKSRAIGIQSRLITAVGADAELAQAPARESLDAGGHLVSPAFVDAHFHLDSALRHGQPRPNASGTLLEGIAIWGELKPTLTQESIIQTAIGYCQWAVANGILSIRSHVDTSDPRLLTVEALLEVRTRVKPWLDLQLVAFPQDGLLRQPDGLKNLKRALAMGVDVVGGIPHFERTSSEGAQSIELLCKIAADQGLSIDMHCDETDDPLSRHVETLAAQTLRMGLKGRVTGSHLTSMHSMDNSYASKLIDLMVEAELSVIANPLINVTLQGRHDTYPKRRGITRVPELMKAGLTVAFGQDCVLDPWYGLGSADMLEVAHMGLHLTQMTSQSGIQACFDAITHNPAKILGLQNYGIAPGCQADLVILQATSPMDAIRLRANRLAVIRQGRAIARTPERKALLSWGEKPIEVDWLL
jgi:cytosine/creatinine deaminase